MRPLHRQHPGEIAGPVGAVLVRPQVQPDDPGAAPASPPCDRLAALVFEAESGLITP